MTAWYNENNADAAATLRLLIDEGAIAPGVVDERSILDVKPCELEQYTQCHFFAGAGVWSYALRQAGWPDDRPVWTGSCPCQPFTKTGSQLGFADERHLWPFWMHLIKVNKPVTILGEQAANKGVHPWIDLVQDDLEGEGYAFSALDLPACGFGAPHARQRTYFVGNANFTGLAGQPWDDRVLTLGESPFGPTTTPSVLSGPWVLAEWLRYKDSKFRPNQPGALPMADGTPTTVGQVRLFGNAIVAEVAVGVIAALMQYTL